MTDIFTCLVAVIIIDINLLSISPVTMNFTCDYECPYVKDQDYKLIDDHREIDDVSEKTTPSKTPKSPQKTSKRPKTVPFKVTLLDTSDYEAGIEVRNLPPEECYVLLLQATFPSPGRNKAKYVCVVLPADATSFFTFGRYVFVVIML